MFGNNVQIMGGTYDIIPVARLVKLLKLLDSIQLSNSWLLLLVEVNLDIANDQCLIINYCLLIKMKIFQSFRSIFSTFPPSMENFQYKLRSLHGWAMQQLQLGQRNPCSQTRTLMSALVCTCLVNAHVAWSPIFKPSGNFNGNLPADTTHNTPHTTHTAHTQLAHTRHRHMQKKCKHLERRM